MCLQEFSVPEPLNKSRGMGQLDSRSRFLTHAKGRQMLPSVGEFEKWRGSTWLQALAITDLPSSISTKLK